MAGLAVVDFTVCLRDFLVCFFTLVLGASVAAGFVSLESAAKAAVPRSITELNIKADNVFILFFLFLF